VETNTPYFDGCLPIEVMADAAARRCAMADEAGRLTNPHNPTVKAYAIGNCARTTSRHALQTWFGFQTS